MDSLQIYKLQSGVRAPLSVEEFGSRIGAHHLMSMDQAAAEADVRAALPTFRWPVGQQSVEYVSGSIEIELRIAPHGLFAQVRGVESLDALKRIAANAGWLILDPVSMRLLR